MSGVDMTVVVAHARSPFSKEAHVAMVRAVPLSVNSQACISQSFGAPTSPLVIEVMLVASASIFVISELLVLVPGVADEASVSTRITLLLFDIVANDDSVSTSTPSTAIFHADDRVMVVSVALPSSTLHTVKALTAP